MTETSITNPTPSDTQHRACASKLRTVLRLNAANSAIFGTLLTLAPELVDDVLGTGHPGWVRLVGLGLLPFAALCAWLSTASLDQLRKVTPQVVVGDVAWVVISVVTIFAGWYSASGVVAVLAMAVIVDLFALLQWQAWRRLRPTR